jgi:hypothetical protein
MDPSMVVTVVCAVIGAAGTVADACRVDQLL